MAVLESAARYRWVALGIAFLTQWSNNLATQVVGPLAPLLQRELDLSRTEIGVFSAGAFIGAWGVLLVAGFLTDRLGVRKMVTLGQIVAGGFLLSMSVVGSFVQAVVVMFGAGLGRGAVLPGSTKAIMDWFPPGARATAMGVKQTGYPMAGVLTASLLPAVALALGWRFAIAMVGFVILAAGVATAVFYRDARGGARVVDRRGSVRSELGEVIRNRYLWTLSAVALLLVTAQLAMNTYLALYLSEVVLVPSIPDEGTRIVVAGGYLALFHASGGIARVLWGLASDRIFKGQRMVVIAILGACTVFLSAMFGFVGPGFPLGLLALLVAAYGAGAMGYNGLYQTLIAETVGRRRAATGVGLSMTVGQLGTVGGPPLFGFVVDVTGAYPPAWFLLAGLAAAGTLIAAASAGEEKHVP